MRPTQNRNLTHLAATPFGLTLLAIDTLRQYQFVVSTLIVVCPCTYALPIGFPCRRLMFNEFFERVVDVCEAYVLDAPGRGRDWLVELAGMELTLRSQVRSLI